jgi:hypothetical protein
MYIANYPVDNPSDYWKISLCLVFFDYFVEEISKGVVINGTYLHAYSSRKVEH